MTCLILDTTGDSAFIAWAEGGSLLSQTVLQEGRQLSRFLLPSISVILQERRPDFIAIGTGPGSFTGSRVGGIIALTLAYAWKIPLISFPSTLLPHLEELASLSYQKFLSGELSSQIELVYISPSP